MIRTFRPADLYAVNQWEKAHGLRPCKLEQLSTAGWIVPEAAAGWLYLTDSNFCLFDGLVTNPEATAELRAEAIDAIQEQVVKAAKALGYKNLVAVCTSDTLRARGLERYGYRETRKATLLHLGV